jgi:DNA-binding transcriptional ArsR family regulator
MRSQDDETEKLAKILDHPARAKIIELLGEGGPLGWKELSSGVGVKTGALYHHLDALEGLVSRDVAKKYLLTKSGRVVYSRLSEAHTIESVHKAALDLREADRWRRQLASVFTPRSLLVSLTSSPRRALLSFAGFTAAFMILSIVAGVYPGLYFFQETESPLISVMGFASSLGVLFSISFGSSILMRSTADPVPLATASVFSFLPVVAFALLTSLPPLTALSSARISYTICVVFFQTWSATILGAGISVASGVRIERALLVSLALLYATMVLVFLQGKII